VITEAAVVLSKCVSNFSGSASAAAVNTLERNASETELHAVLPY
jgi:hypothetical protein